MGREITDKPRFEFFSATLKRKACIFTEFLVFEERFRKAPFSRRISVDSRSNHFHVCGVFGDGPCLVLVIDMFTEFNLVMFFFCFFRIVKSEMSHVVEKVGSKFIVITRSCHLSLRYSTT